MAKYSLYQIKKSNKELASLSVFYGISDAFTQASARQAFRESKYENTADIEANSTAEVQILVNTDRTNAKILKLGLLRNVGIGDLIHNTETNQWFIVSPTSYDLILIRPR